MELPVTLQNKIVDFLISLPHIDNNDSQYTLIYHAGLDHELQAQISFGCPSVQFVQILVSVLIKYGQLKDGRNALEATLEAAKDYVGHDRQAYCESLLKEVHTSVVLREEQNDQLQKQNDFKEEQKLLSEKIHELRKAYIIESDAVMRFKLKKQIEEEENNLKKLRLQSF